MSVEILKCFKVKEGIYGECYVYESKDDKHLVIINNNDIMILGHFYERKVNECLMRATKQVEEAVMAECKEHLANKGVK